MNHRRIIWRTCYIKLQRAFNRADISESLLVCYNGGLLCMFYAHFESQQLARSEGENLKYYTLKCHSVLLIVCYL